MSIYIFLVKIKFFSIQLNYILFKLNNLLKNKKINLNIKNEINNNFFYIIYYLNIFKMEDLDKIT